MKALLKLRHAQPGLQSDANFHVVYAKDNELTFVYRRGSLLLAVNPSVKTVETDIQSAGEEIFFIGSGSLDKGLLRLQPQSFIIIKEH